MKLPVTWQRDSARSVLEGEAFMHCGKKGVVVKRFNEIGDRPACIAAFRTESWSFAVLMMTRVFGETTWSSFWTSRPLVPGMKISRTARATVLQITYARKTSGSLNNFACKSTDESKRLSAFSIEGSSSTRQIMPAAGGKTAHELTSISIFLRIKRQRER
jgi:hypothetical protein